MNFEPSFWFLLLFPCFLYLSRYGRIFFLITAYGLGFFAAFIKTHAQNHTFLPKRAYNVFLEGRLVEIKKRTPERTKAILQTHHGERVMLFLKDYHEKNDRVKCKVHTWPVPPPLVLKGYDPQFDAFFENIHYYAKGRCQTLEKDTTSSLHQRMKQTLERNLSESASFIAKALLIGDRIDLPKPLRETFARAGVAHILAISGLHMSILGGSVFLFLRCFLVLLPFFRDHFIVKKYAAAATFPFLLYYAFLSGFALPVQRALIMSCFFILGILFDRKVFSSRGLCLAALIILIVSPQSLFSVGFQLSFCAVAALVLFYENHPQRYFFLNPFLTTGLATLATTPLIASTFHTLTLHSFTGNIVVVPFLSFLIFPTLLLSFLFSPLWLLTNFFIEKMILYVTWVSSLPGAHIPIPSYHPLVNLFFFFGFFLFLCKRKWWGGTGVAISLLLYLFLPSPLPNLSMSGQNIFYTKNNKVFFSSSSFFKYHWQKALGHEKTFPAKTQKIGPLSLVIKKKKTSISLKDAYFDASTLKDKGTLFGWRGPHNSWILKTTKDIDGLRPWRLY